MINLHGWQRDFIENFAGAPMQDINSRDTRLYRAAATVKEALEYSSKAENRLVRGV